MDVPLSEPLPVHLAAPLPVPLAVPDTKGVLKGVYRRECNKEQNIYRKQVYDLREKGFTCCKSSLIILHNYGFEVLDKKVIVVVVSPGQIFV